MNKYKDLLDAQKKLGKAKSPDYFIIPPRIWAEIRPLRLIVKLAKLATPDRSVE